MIEFKDLFKNRKTIYLAKNIPNSNNNYTTDIFKQDIENCVKIQILNPTKVNQSIISFETLLTESESLALLNKHPLKLNDNQILFEVLKDDHFLNGKINIKSRDNNNSLRLIEKKDLIELFKIMYNLCIDFDSIQYIKQDNQSSTFISIFSREEVCTLLLNNPPPMIRGISVEFTRSLNQLLLVPQESLDSIISNSNNNNNDEKQLSPDNNSIIKEIREQLSSELPTLEIIDINLDSNNNIVFIHFNNNNSNNTVGQILNHFKNKDLFIHKKKSVLLPFIGRYLRFNNNTTIDTEKYVEMLLKDHSQYRINYFDSTKNSGVINVVSDQQKTVLESIVSFNSVSISFENSGQSDLLTYHALKNTANVIFGVNQDSNANQLVITLAGNSNDIDIISQELKSKKLQSIVLNSDNQEELYISQITPENIKEQFNVDITFDKSNMVIHAFGSQDNLDRLNSWIGVYTKPHSKFEKVKLSPGEIHFIEKRLSEELNTLKVNHVIYQQSILLSGDDQSIVEAISLVDEMKSDLKPIKFIKQFPIRLVNQLDSLKEKIPTDVYFVYSILDEQLQEKQLNNNNLIKVELEFIGLQNNNWKDIVDNVINPIKDRSEGKVRIVENMTPNEFLFLKSYLENKGYSRNVVFNQENKSIEIIGLWMDEIDSICSEIYKHIGNSLYKYDYTFNENDVYKMEFIKNHIKKYIRLYSVAIKMQGRSLTISGKRKMVDIAATEILDLVSSLQLKQYYVTHYITEEELEQELKRMVLTYNVQYTVNFKKLSDHSVRVSGPSYEKWNDIDTLIGSLTKIEVLYPDASQPPIKAMPSLPLNFAGDLNLYLCVPQPQQGRIRLVGRSKANINYAIKLINDIIKKEKTSMKKIILSDFLFRYLQSEAQDLFKKYQKESDFKFYKSSNSLLMYGKTYSVTNLYSDVNKELNERNKSISTVNFDIASFIANELLNPEHVDKFFEKHQILLSSPPPKVEPNKIVNSKYYKKVHIEICDGNILNETTDCIVNAANTRLAHGGGVAGAIARAAGAAFNKESFDYVNKNGEVPTGSAALTSAGSLKYKGVIHAVAPIWSNSKKQECWNLMISAIYKTLELANDNGFKSISIPAIGSGIFGVPKDVAAKTIIDGIIKFIDINMTGIKNFSIENVRLCDIDYKAIQCWRDVLGELKEVEKPAPSNDRNVLQSTKLSFTGLNMNMINAHKYLNEYIEGTLSLNIRLPITRKEYKQLQPQLAEITRYWNCVLSDIDIFYLVGFKSHIFDCEKEIMNLIRDFRLQQQNTTTNNNNNNSINITQTSDEESNIVEYPWLNSSNQVDNLNLYNIEENSEIWNEIQSKLKTLPNFKLEKIEHIRNKKLWRNYTIRKNEFEQKEESKDQVFEKLLFSGTTKDPIKIYANDGYDLHDSLLDDTFGRGFYFSDQPNYVHEKFPFTTTINTSNGGNRSVNQLFLSKVLVGSDYQVNTNRSSSVRSPPMKSTRRYKNGEDVLNLTEYYDSISVVSHSSKLYCINESNRAYPLYLITYSEK